MAANISLYFLPSLLYLCSSRMNSLASHIDFFLSKSCLPKTCLWNEIPQCYTFIPWIKPSMNKFKTDKLCTFYLISPQLPFSTSRLVCEGSIFYSGLLIVELHLLWIDFSWKVNGRTLFRHLWVCVIVMESFPLFLARRVSTRTPRDAQSTHNLIMASNLLLRIRRLHSSLLRLLELETLVVLYRWMNWTINVKLNKY